jgi:hypothetical protein
VAHFHPPPKTPALLCVTENQDDHLGRGWCREARMRRRDMTGKGDMTRRRDMTGRRDMTTRRRCGNDKIQEQQQENLDMCLFAANLSSPSLLHTPRCPICISSVRSPFNLHFLLSLWEAALEFCYPGYLGWNLSFLVRAFLYYLSI